MLELISRSAIIGRLASIGHGDGVAVSERELALATVIALGDDVAFREAVRRVTGIAPVDGPNRATDGDTAFVGTGPRTWLASSASNANLASELARNLSGLAAVSDQSDGYVVLRLIGPKVRATLAKGVAIDLHPRAFHPGDAAVTIAAHFGVVIWQLDDAPTYDVAVFRSLATDFCHWLSESAAEFGLVVESGRG